MHNTTMQVLGVGQGGGGREGEGEIGEARMKVIGRWMGKKVSEGERRKKWRGEKS